MSWKEISCQEDVLERTCYGLARSQKRNGSVTVTFIFPKNFAAVELILNFN
jgi:hypothetical protein